VDTENLRANVIDAKAVAAELVKGRKGLGR
jgi:hypothetical protein